MIEREPPRARCAERERGQAQHQRQLVFTYRVDSLAELRPHRQRLRPERWMEQFAPNLSQQLQVHCDSGSELIIPGWVLVLGNLLRHPEFG